jgi:ribosome-associated translation inhibitor RaiA
MRVQLRTRDLPKDEALHEYVDRRARFAIGRFAAWVPSLRVTLSDANGPRGGVDKSCRATANLDGLPSITVSSLDASTRDAVDRALARLARAVRRAFDIHADPRLGATWLPRGPVAGVAVTPRRRRAKVATP